MRNAHPVDSSPRLLLDTATAADLMTPNPVSIRADASVQEAITMLTDKGFSAAPVIDESGQPIGVLSHTDIMVHDREKGDPSRTAPEQDDPNDLVTPEEEPLASSFEVEQVEWVPVRDLMTPTVFSVAPETPAQEVIDHMLSLKVHRLFVVDRSGVLVGVISALDVLRLIRSSSINPHNPCEPHLWPRVGLSRTK
jgi:CBS domain-containing protein